MMLTDSLFGSSRVGNRRGHALRALAVIGLLFWNAPELSADTVTASWNRNSESNIAGYILSYGTQSGGPYTTSTDVGNVTSRQVVLTAGQRYYFVVQAYNTSSLVSARSAEVFFDVGVARPSITSLSPASGSVGTAVTINGANFGATQGTSTVRFNGTSATTITSWSATRIVAAVPSGATTGSVVVTVGGVASNGVAFTVVGSAPTVTSLSPTSGGVGTSVTITGTNFGATQGTTSTVRFNGTSATTITSWSATRIVAAVPSGATTGPVTVTVGGVASNGMTFTVGSATPSPITLTQHAGVAAGANGTTATLAFPANNVGGNFIAVVTRAYTANQSFTVTDTRGNLYRRALTLNNNTNDTLAIYYAENIAAGSNTVTVRVSVSTAAPIRFAILEYAGIARTNALDVTATATQSSASPSSGSATTTTAGDLVIGAFSTQSYRTVAAGSGYTIREVVAAAPSTVLTVEDRIQPTAGAVSATATLNSSDLWGAGLASFKKASTATNLAPTLTQPANQTSAENATVSLPLVATDPENAPLMYSATGLPASLSVNPTTGVIAGTLTSTSAGTYTVTATASDGSLTNSKTFTWTVTDVVASAPRITSLSPTSGVAGTVVTIAGTNFGATRLTTSTVTFNGTPATPTTWSATSIVVPVPAGATTGNVVVTVGGLASNGVGFTVSAPRAITLVQRRSRDGGTTTASTLAFNANNGAGNFIAVVIRAGGSGAGLAVTDTRGNTYRQAARFARGTDHVGAIYYAENVGSGANTVTVSVTSASTMRFAILEYAGVAASSALDRAVTAVGSGTSPSSGTLTTTTNGDLLLGAITIDDNVNVVAGAGYTIRESIPALPSTKAIAEDRIQASAGAASATGTLSVSASWGAALAAFKPAPSGAALAALTSETLASTSMVSAASEPVVEPVAAPRTDDYDGDGHADVAVLTPSTGTWSILESSTGTALTATLGAAGDRPVPGDYDGDGKTDIAVYHPATGEWSVLLSSTGALSVVAWGANADLPVPADYDGDGKTDRAVYRPASGEWIVFQSSTRTTRRVWGSSADVPVPGDYDGDRKADLAVYRPTTGLWQVLQSGTNTATTATRGSTGDLPMPGDYDGDGRTDVAVYDAATGWWSILQSGTNTTRTALWGSSSDLPMPGDYDGDGTTDLAVFRPSTGLWQILQSSTNTTKAVTWGRSTDMPVR